VGRLAGFRYREIARKLKAFGFQFDRQVAGSHEIWSSQAGGDRSGGLSRRLTFGSIRRPWMKRYRHYLQHPAKKVSLALPRTVVYV
jgi:hypothetical protein